MLAPFILFILPPAFLYKPLNTRSACPIRLKILPSGDVMHSIAFIEPFGLSFTSTAALPSIFTYCAAIWPFSAIYLKNFTAELNMLAPFILFILSPAFLYKPLNTRSACPMRPKILPSGDVMHSIAFIEPFGL